MAHEWRKSRDMPDFTRNGNETGGGRLVWLLVVLAVLGGLVLASTFVLSPLPTGGDDGTVRIPAPAMSGD
ncbi:hypothetical protein [Roseovarius amoyensis]|uniref:hypothetical protein n=1 Tax=Roseovarius amoyensis TaxID=2211448 RepID=UPI000DBE91BB|nr:hypothetical protein [Roseovarius amoyensis]